MSEPFGSMSGMTAATGTSSRDFPPAPVEELDYDAVDPPDGELGSSFPYDGPFSEWEDGNVYAYEEPMVRDYQHMGED